MGTMADTADRQPIRLTRSGPRPEGARRREFCRLLGLAAIGISLGLKRSLAGVAALDGAIAGRNMVDCPEQHCVIEVDSNGTERSRY